MIKAKNIFIQKKLKNSVDFISSQCDNFFIGDEMMIANKNMHFFEDEHFYKILNATATSEVYQGMAWRMHNLVWASKMALGVKGDFIECGVFRGFKSYFLLKYLQETISDRNYYLFDTFEGIDQKQSHLSPINKAEHNKTGLYDFIKFRFKGFENVIIKQGIVPHSLIKAQLKKVAFLHLDMNSYQAEIAALNHLWDKISVGGVIVLDDFGLSSHKAQMQHELPWLQERKQNILELPTGQAIIIKS